MNSHHKYFEKELRKLPTAELWQIIEELLSSRYKMPDKSMMNYEQVLELCIILKETDEMVRNLEQIAILKNGLEDNSN
ncbi:MAG: hypothetical protein ACREBI_05025 [Nitrosotalea sp.]